MTTGWRRWKKFGLASWLIMGGAIAFWENCVLAQITPDTTLGNENSTVKSTGAVDAIDGGATRGANLLHSFGEFNVSEGRSAYFTNPAGIENILSRVTGGNPSQILGKLGVLGNANLFLINLNGIIFGQNASLDVGGSFVGTTANAIGLTNGDIFSTNPQVPLPTGLLNVNPNALLFNQIKAQAMIANRSTSDSKGLQMPQSKSLLLVGGDVNLEGGQIFAPGGRVELGGIAGQGTVGLNVDNSDLRLNFPENVARTGVSLTNDAEVNVRAGGGGSLVINAQSLNIEGRSNLLAGIDRGLGSVDSKAGDITLNATEAINVNEASIIDNSVLSRAVGRGGNISITTGSLSVTNGAYLSASTRGQGNAGSVNINARDTVSFDGVGSNGFASEASSRVYGGSVGNSGGINITTGSLSVTNGAYLSASTRGQGNAGSVNINAHDTVSFDGVGSNGFSSAVFSTMESTTVGNGGDINITTGALSVTNGAFLNASTRGQGNAGSVNINARDIVSFNGVGSNGFSSGAFSLVNNEAVGNSGSINITTGSLFVTNRTQLATGILGQGDAGSINIFARDTISFDGESGALSRVEFEGVGQGGDINVIATSLSLTNGAELAASTRGYGDAGSVNIQVSNSVFLDGVSNNGVISGAFSTVSPRAIGRGGDVNVTAGSLSASNGSQLNTAIFGQGDGGSVTLNVRDTISFDGAGSNGLGSGAFSTVNFEGIGKGGNINVTTGSLFATNGAGLAASTFGNGDAGSVTIIARDLVSFDGVNSNVREAINGMSINGSPSGVGTAVFFNAVGNGGDINITTGSLAITNGAGLAANSFGQGNSGSIKIDARDTVSIDGVNRNSSIDGTGESLDNSSSGLSTQVTSEAVGNGGDINITTSLLSVTNGALLSASSGGSGAAGNIEVAARSIRLDNQALLSSDTIAGQGNIFLRSGDLRLLGGSNITTDATGTATGGNISIDADLLVALGDSNIRANAEEAFGGRVRIKTQGIFKTPESDITASSALGSEFNGTVDINTPGIEPNRGLVNLAVQPVEARVAQTCQPSGSQATSEFVVTGRGGLPPNPTEALSSDAIQIDWVTLYPKIEDRSSSDVSTNPTVTEPALLAEAQGWVIGNNGEVILTASASTTAPHSSWQTSAQCHDS